MILLFECVCTCVSERVREGVRETLIRIQGDHMQEMQAENWFHAQGNLQKLYLQFVWMGWKQRFIYPARHHSTPTSSEEPSGLTVSTCDSVVTFSSDRFWDVLWRQPISYHKHSIPALIPSLTGWQLTWKVWGHGEIFTGFLLMLSNTFRH